MRDYTGFVHKSTTTYTSTSREYGMLCEDTVDEVPHRDGLDGYKLEYGEVYVSELRRLLREVINKKAS